MTGVAVVDSVVAEERAVEVVVGVDVSVLEVEVCWEATGLDCMA